MHDQSKITRRRALQMAVAVAGLGPGGARGARAQAQPQMQPRIERLAPEFDKIISVGEPIKELASGFGAGWPRQLPYTPEDQNQEQDRQPLSYDYNCKGTMIVIHAHSLPWSSPHLNAD